MQQDLHFRRFDGTIVVLDLVPDRYRLLKGAAADRFINSAEGKASPADIGWLQQNGFRADAIKAAANRQASLKTPSSSIDFKHLGEASLLATARASWLQRRYRAALKSNPLHKILGDLYRLRASSPPNDYRNISAIASAFERAKTYIPTRDQCLARSLAMTHMLWKAGIEAKLVFGVTLPFSAHCWVQYGDEVLSDPIDRILPFHPIMVVQ